MIAPELEQWLSRIHGALQIVKGRAENAVRRYCDTNGFAYAGRMKTDGSAAEKLETGRVKGFNELDDLFGCTIIIPSLSHEERVLEALCQMFNCFKLRKRGETKKNPDVFRFEATRFIGKLRITEADDPQLGDIPFEVQIRTAFEHAWSVATHSPVYKGQRIDWKLRGLPPK